MSVSVNAKDFIKAWQLSQSRREVSTRTGMRVTTADQRALYYRQHGVPLKPMPKRPPHDWKELAAYANKVLNAA